MSKVRIEKDSMGELEVPANALYGAQTQRAINNFPVSGLVVPRAFISALGQIKAACAQVNCDLGEMDQAQTNAIITASNKVSGGEYDEQFPIDIFQTGSGTSTNMNANEVIAHLASTAELKIHPNDHVNMGQSSNDVIPTAIHVSASLQTAEQLIPALSYLKEAIDKRGNELKGVVKTGRTHLMDAMPVSLAQELSG
ncbi:MAG: lyase family protein, partial [Gammaproteobacteria bacterium]|nr:lyase family protein [Gammaproteobacteria bacterium]